jgi:hypothetical protein
MGGEAALKLEDVNVDNSSRTDLAYLSVPLRIGMRAFGGRIALIILPEASNW